MFGRTAKISTEHFTILGDLNKNSVRGDLSVTIQTERMTETTNHIVLELQSTKDHTMGFRMFVYSLNMAEEKDDGNTYIFPNGVTIYTTLDLPKSGTDEVHMQIEHFRVGDTSYSAKDGDLLTVEFPYINLLAMKYEEFQQSPLEPLKVLYPYRYRKNPKLLKNEVELQYILENIKEFTISQEGGDRLVINGLVRELLIDIVEICKKNQAEYRKGLEVMEMVHKSSTEILIEESKLEGKLEGVIEGEIRGKLEVARNLLEKLATTEIAAITGLPLAKTEELRVN